MLDNNPFLSSEAVQMLVTSLTDLGRTQLSELEAECFLNALARAQSGVPTGVHLEPNQSSNRR